MTAVSIYFYTGDFAGAVRRADAGEPQTYGTHGELVALARSLVAQGHTVRMLSFVSELTESVRPYPGLEIVSLGALDHTTSGVLAAAVRADPSDLILAHFPHDELLDAAAASDARVMVILASSYNDRGLKPWVRRRRLARRLNNPRFEWIANHCMPATRQLAGFGVRQDRLLAWDIAHPEQPAALEPRLLAQGPCRLFYVGGITVDKGVGDLIEAVGLASRNGLDVTARLAGGGAIGEMARLAESNGVASRVEFLGVVPNSQVADEMRAATAIVVPSRPAFPEGLPLALFEAVASRTPIVCSDHPMFRDHFVDGRSAVTFRAGDAARLARAVERLAGDPALYARLSEQAIHTWRAMEGPVTITELITHWVNDPHPSSWLRARTLAASSSDR